MDPFGSFAEGVRREPSASAVVREALDFFLAALRDAELEQRLEAGYAMLKTDQDRDQVLEAASLYKGPPGRSARVAS